MGEISLTVEDGVESEVALAIIGRAQDIHENTDDINEDIAEELKEVGQSLYANYSDDAPNYFGE